MLGIVRPTGSKAIDVTHCVHALRPQQVLDQIISRLIDVGVNAVGREVPDLGGKTDANVALRGDQYLNALPCVWSVRTRSDSDHPFIVDQWAGVSPRSRSPPAQLKNWESKVPAIKIMAVVKPFSSSRQAA